mmetsp:Transcript_21156/g.32153  ORF Transcript_21156/g.32153 Transcript_21156/m.32153 type:complete len:362 (+) Transcript_21156:153-1238(+)
MPLFTTATSVAAVGSVTAIILRRRISRKWISFRDNQTDLTNKTIVITGGNVGLGYEAAKDFSRRNGNVVIACRNVGKGKEAAKLITSSTGKDNIECLELDLASLASVRKFISKLQSEPKFSSIHALVCNAGVWIPPPKDEDENDSITTTTTTKTKTTDGFEMHFGVNHLSHFLLARSLQDQLARSGDGRIVFVASSLMKSGQIDMESKDFVHNMRKKKEEPGKKSRSFAPTAYCDTKLMNVLTCKHLSTILPPSITTYSVCPGFCRTSLGRNVSFSFPKKVLIAPLMLMIQRTSNQGAQNIIHATIEDKEKLQSGMMYRDGEIGTEHMEYADSLGEDLAEKLFNLSEQLLTRDDDDDNSRD